MNVEKSDYGSNSTTISKLVFRHESYENKITNRAPKLRIAPADILERKSIVALHRRGTGRRANTKSVDVEIAACSNPKATDTFELTHRSCSVFSMKNLGLPQRKIMKKM